MANNFFKNGDKAYSENLNDSILVGNAFDWTVDVALPDDTGDVFPNSSSVVKGKVTDLSITPNSNLSIGSSIENNSGSSQIYRLTVYPNYNRFGGFKSITLEGDGTFYIANKGGNTPIVNNLDYDNLDNVPELKVLKEYDIVVTIPNGGEVTGLSFVLHSTIANVSGSINQSNVSGLDSRLDSIESDINGIADVIYPVGSIYMSVNSTSPSVLFGGAWERIEDMFLLGATTQTEVGDTGGEETHTLTTNEMPSHTHTQNSHNHNMDSSGYSAVAVKGDNWAYGTKGQMQMNTGNYYYPHSSTSANGIAELSNTANATATNQSTGGGQSHNNMPPYMKVNIWKRTA